MQWCILVCIDVSISVARARCCTTGGAVLILPKGIPSLQGGESTHGVATGCGIAGANGTDSTGCPTSFPSGQVCISHRPAGILKRPLMGCCRGLRTLALPTASETAISALHEVCVLRANHFETDVS